MEIRNKVEELKHNNFSLVLKRFFGLSILWILSLVFCLSAYAEEIRSFDVDIQTYKDSSFLVTEQIDYDFGDVERHGIHRVIPVVYTRGTNDYRIELKLSRVVDEKGEPYEVEKVLSGQKVNIRIGSPSYTMTGRHIITVQYLVRKGINFFDGAPEIFWNVTGHDWHVPIARVTCTIHPPPGVRASSIRYSCFAGRHGTKEEGVSLVRDDGVVLKSDWLKPGDHFMTIAGFPKGSVREPGFKLKLLWWLEDWWPALVVPAFSAFALGAIYWKFGRENVTTGALVPRYSRFEDLSPAEVGTLIDERCDMHDIVATLLDLAGRGLLKIKQLNREDPYGFDEPSYQLVRLKSTAGAGQKKVSLTRFEEIFLSGIFEKDGQAVDSVFLSDLKFNFQSRVPDIKEDIYERLVRNGFFQTNPHEERKVYYSLAFVLLAVGALILFLAAEVHSVIAWALGLLLSACMAAASAPYMPSRSNLGCQKVREIHELVEFIRTASVEDVEKLENEPEEVFSHTLPYAMVLGMEDRFAALFSSLLKRPPSWYEPLEYFGASEKGDFDARGFVLDLGACVRTIQSTLVATPPPPPTAFKGAAPVERGSGFGAGGFGGGS